MNAHSCASITYF